MGSLLYRDTSVRLTCRHMPLTQFLSLQLSSPPEPSFAPPFSTPTFPFSLPSFPRREPFSLLPLLQAPPSFSLLQLWVSLVLFLSLLSSCLPGLSFGFPIPSPSSLLLGSLLWSGPLAHLFYPWRYSFEDPVQSKVPAYSRSLFAAMISSHPNGLVALVSPPSHSSGAHYPLSAWAWSTLLTCVSSQFSWICWLQRSHLSESRELLFRQRSRQPLPIFSSLFP